MKVNMTPNPLDVVTIHASQGDTEARQWEFELHNNGELIDTSEITEQMFFKAYKGGTEQLLPENTSTPTTSPFKGDIKYPQGLLTDQEFTYRQSPTENDGLAKITDIKGNTIVWNQLVKNGNFAESSFWSGQSTTVSISNGVANVTLSAKGNYVALRQSPLSSVTGHKYFVTATFKCTKKTAIGFYLNGQSVYLDGYDIPANTLTTVYSLIGGGESGGFNVYVSRKNELDVGDVVQVSNVMLIDLTQMGFDSITDPSGFTSLFPLSYYAYNQGSLLSFNGNGIKTVGKNQSQLVSMSTVSGGFINASSGDIATVKKGITYTLSFDNLTPLTSNVVARILVDGAWKQQGYKNLVANSRWDLTFTATDDGALGLSAGLGSQYSEVKVFDNIQLEFGSTATDYEPYASSTLSLPISTYFPTGMKSAGNVYDELTPTKGITRIGAVDMGSLNWSYISANKRFIAIVSGAKSSSNLTVLENIISAKYENATWENILTQAEDKIISLHYTSNNSYVAVIDNNYSDASTFKSAMSGVYLYYELATPTETSFTTASLVTENAEIPLSNNDGVLLGKCTEELSENPGFIDAKIKLADSDGECYSNKIQLHVERKPS